MQTRVAFDLYSFAEPETIGDVCAVEIFWSRDRGSSTIQSAEGHVDMLCTVLGANASRIAHFIFAASRPGGCVSSVLAVRYHHHRTFIAAHRLGTSARCGSRWRVLVR